MEEIVSKMIDINTNLGTTLKVMVTGGSPVGLGFALLLESLMGSKVAIKVYDGGLKRGHV
jgi:hypothetical protein